MLFKDYTPSQQKAITESGSNIIVSAGAGSGKTQVLTERVIYFIKNKGYNIKDFLILTFTNLAAGEMRTRIRKALAEEGLDKSNNVDIAHIQTFDSFSFELVKKYHFLLQVPRNIDIVDTTTLDVKVRTELESILEEYYKGNNKSFNEMIEKYTFKDDKDIVNLILNVYDEAHLSLDTNEFLNNFIDHYFSNDAVEQIYNETCKNIKDEIAKLKSLAYDLPSVPVSKMGDRPYITLVLNEFNNLFNAFSFDDIISSIPVDFKLSLPPGKCTEEEKKTKADFFNLYKEFSNKYLNGPKTKEEFISLLNSQKQYSEVIIEIVKELDERIQQFKKEKNISDFTDIAKLALNLIKDNEEVRLELKNSLKMIMVDEYQDTSKLQEDFINLIENNNIYMVGDVKQSIYRFRNARCDIFINKYNKYKNHDGGIAIDLNRNFRSRKEVLSDINYIFKQVMTIPFGGADYYKDHMIEYGQKGYLKGQVDSRSHMIVYPKGKSLENLECEARSIALDIISKVNSKYLVYDKSSPTFTRPCKFSDFCIIMDRSTSFNDYSKIFSEYKIPLYIENDEDIKSNMLVLVLKNLLKLIKCIINKDYHSQELKQCFVAVARSFLFEYSDSKLYELCTKNSFYDDEIISSLRNIIYTNSTLSIDKLFEKIIYEFDIYYKLLKIGDIEKNEKYLDTFLDMFKNMAVLDYGLDEFITFLENINTYNLKFKISSTGSKMDAVKMLNIHKSKGLEFNIIYFPGLYKHFNLKDLSVDINYSKEYGIYFPSEVKDGANYLKELNQKHELQESISEFIRLFYVALTRTKEQMIFVNSVEDLDDAKYEFANYKIKEYQDKLINVTCDKVDYLIEAYNNHYIDSYILNELLKPYNLEVDEEIDKDLLLTKDMLVEKEIEEEPHIDTLDILIRANNLEKLSSHLKNNNLLLYKEELAPLYYAYKEGIITLQDFTTYLKAVGYDITSSLEEDLFNCLSINQSLIDNYINDKKPVDVIFDLIYKQYGSFIEKLKCLLGYYNLELTPNFDVDKEHIDNLINYVDVKKDTINDLIDIRSFKDLFDLVSNNNRFTKVYYNTSLVDYPIISQDIEYEDYDFIDLDFTPKEDVVIRPSKEITADTNKNNLEFGNKLHFVLESTDFKNPDYSQLDELEQETVKAFLASDLMKNMDQATIYKEYEFIDNDINGIIDLMLIYDDYIDIIDYKTKNIDDPLYKKQLGIYKDYAKKTFGKKVHTYLYSLLDKKYLQLD